MNAKEYVEGQPNSIIRSSADKISIIKNFVSKNLDIYVDIPPETVYVLYILYNIIEISTINNVVSNIDAYKIPDLLTGVAQVYSYIGYFIKRSPHLKGPELWDIEIIYIKKAIEYGDVHAMHNFAHEYENIENFVFALKYYKMAFKNGFLPAVNRIAAVYCKERLYDKFKKYFLKVIELIKEGRVTRISKVFEPYLKENNDYSGLILYYLSTKEYDKIVELLFSSKITSMVKETVELLVEFFRKQMQTNDNALFLFVGSIIESKISLLDVHFRYVINADGYDSAKSDFYERIGKQTDS